MFSIGDFEEKAGKIKEGKLGVKKRDKKEE